MDKLTWADRHWNWETLKGSFWGFWARYWWLVLIIGWFSLMGFAIYCSRVDKAAEAAKFSDL